LGKSVLLHVQGSIDAARDSLKLVWKQPTNQLQSVKRAKGGGIAFFFRGNNNPAMVQVASEALRNQIVDEFNGIAREQEEESEKERRGRVRQHSVLLNKRKSSGQAGAGKQAQQRQQQR
tara:strand:+ start:163 stop:519 length:357 start_codon:yes stop_codon:yes gene_type:complete